MSQESNCPKITIVNQHEAAGACKLRRVRKQEGEGGGVLFEYVRRSRLEARNAKNKRQTQAEGSFSFFFLALGVIEKVGLV